MSTVKVGHKYALDVVSGKIPAGKLHLAACSRYVSDRKKAKTKAFDYYFDEDTATHALRFFDFLRHSKGEWAGQPIELTPFHTFMLMNIFGWLHKRTHLRRFRTCYIEVPRKNAKSTIISGLGLYQLFDEPGSEVYSAATKKDQAKIVFTEACRMVRASPELRSRINIYRDSLNLKKGYGVFAPLGSDKDTLDGLNVQCALIDELHAHKSRGVYDVLDTATGARRHPLIIAITTAGEQRTGICWEQHVYTEKVVTGAVVDETFFGLIAHADEDDDPFDEATWIKANPLYGISVKPDDLARKAAKAREMPAAEASFRRLHLNQWTDLANQWLSMAAWDKCPGDAKLDDFEGQQCWAGLDVSSTIDLTSLALVFPQPRGYAAFWWNWMPSENIFKNNNRDRANYPEWTRDGLITATEGTRIDYDFVIAQVLKLHERFDIQELAIDRYGAQSIINAIKAEDVNVIPFGQGYISMSAPSKEFQALILDGALNHGGNPVARWAASNCSITMDPAENIKPNKAKSASRIDPIVAVIMAIGAHLLSEEEIEQDYEVITLE